MIAVIFEVQIKKGQQENYLRMAAKLREHLTQAEGFISIERFSSLSEDGKLCSLSFWEDEASIRQWREFGPHRQAQETGKAHIFADFRIRIATVSRDYGMFNRQDAPG